MRSNQQMFETGGTVFRRGDNNCSASDGPRVSILCNESESSAGKLALQRKSVYIYDMLLNLIFFFFFFVTRKRTALPRATNYLFQPIWSLVVVLSLCVLVSGI